MARRIMSLGVAALLVAALAPTAGAAAPPDIPDELRAFSIIPPGQSGLSFTPHVDDQLGMYRDLVNDDNVGENELDTYFHSFQFGPGGTIEREYSPAGRNDVTVYRDAFGIPHIYGDSDEAAGFALGYTTAEDRLWHMDVLRHAAEGRISEFLGDSAVDFDKKTRRDGYTKKEVMAQYQDLLQRFPQDGALLDALVQGFADGVNARIAEIAAGQAPRPGEYLVQGLDIEEWQPYDSLAMAIFQLRDFGGDGGGQILAAAKMRRLQSRLGKKLGKKVFKDGYFINDADNYTSVPPSEGTFPSPAYGPTNHKAVAIPDKATKVQKKFYARSANRRIERMLPESPSSHFIAVSGDMSESGNPLEWGGPQVGFSIPQFFIEVDVHSPSFDFRGPALPGASFLVPIGRGTGHAWSLTTGVSNLIDERAEKLCNPKGNKVRKSSKYYRYKGRCRKMKGRRETIHVKGTDKVEKTKIFRTVHGPVVTRGSVRGMPAAFTAQRAYWDRELDFLITGVRINSNSMDSVEEFDDALSIAPLSFNAVYIDDIIIGFWHVGRFPIRATGVDPLLPSWGTGKWEWQGFLPWDENPHVVDPDQGWVVNWNNQPSQDWNGDSYAGWGPTQRVRLLADKMADLTSGGGKVKLSDVVDVIRESATQDADAVLMADRILGKISAPAGTSGDALAALGTWMGSGAHRADQDGDKKQDFGAAVALWDTFLRDLIDGIFLDELGDLNDFGVKEIVDDPASGNGSSYFLDYTVYLWNILGGKGDKYRVDYCDDIDTGNVVETCNEQIQAAFDAAVAALTAAKGNDVSAWTWPYDKIEFEPLGAPSVPDIPWQNRGTFNQAVEATGP